MYLEAAGRDKDG